MYVPQRHRLPLSPCSTCSTVGLGFSARNALLAMTNPGVQKAALLRIVLNESRNQRVRLATLREAFNRLDIFALSVYCENAAGQTALPPIITVHAPQLPRSQTFFAPVNSSCWRSASSKVTRGSTVRFSRFPFTWRVIGTGPGPTDSEAFWPRALFCRTPAPRVPPRLTPRIKPQS